VGGYMGTIYPKIKNIPFLSVSQMKTIDRKMIHDYHINLLQMMENAGRALASFVRDFYFYNQIKNKKIAVFAGTGGNGGGAITAARRLKIWGAEPVIYLTRRPADLSRTAKHQLIICENLHIPVYENLLLFNSKYDLIIDGIIGYNLKGNPDGMPKEYIEFINESGIKTVSLDIPSGMNGDTGPSLTTVEPDSVLSLALPKKCLFNIKDYRIFLADISVPNILYEEVGLNLNYLFVKSDIIEVLMNGNLSTVIR
jgi:NAD(P)H-hydrate epimerase